MSTNYFTYRGIDISYNSQAEFWVGRKHGYGDDCAPHGYARTLRKAMNEIDEHFDEMENDDE